MMRSVLQDELGDDVPDEDSGFSVGYFEGRHQTKRWVVTEEDLDVMYEKFTSGEIFLWCVGKEPEKHDEDVSSKGKKRKYESTVTKRQEKEDELDGIYQDLQQKHGNLYSGPQLRLWARMIIAGTHDDLDEPPRVPMITGAVPPKKQRQETLTDAIAGAATALAKAFGGSAIQTPTTSAGNLNSVGISPGKAADIRMKHLEQLRYLQRLMEDRIISEEEFLEQKQIILNTLRKLV